MIARLAQIELSQLLEQFPAVGVIGPRQVGKTTLVKQVKSENCLYLDLESDIDLSKLSDPGLFLRANSAKTIIIDEVQTMPELFPLLRSIIDEDRRPGRFILLGSAAPSLIRNSTESLAGRIAYLELSSFLLNEVDKPENLWIKGGFPQSFLEANSKKSMIWRNQFISSYIQRDLPLLGMKIAPRMLSNLLRMLANDTGNLWNASNYARSLGITSPTAKTYVNFLEGAFLIDILEPYFTNVKKRITKTPKVLFKDTGILHALLRIATLDDLQGHSIIGNSWENFVIMQIKGHFRDQFEYYFYRTQDGTEMDLVLTQGGKPKCGIEIKYTLSPKITKSMTLAAQDLATPKNFVVTPGEDRYAISEKFEVIGLNVLLQKLNQI